MNCLEILRAEWVTFFDRFSLQHEYWLANLFLIEPDGSKHLVAHELPLQAIATNLKSGEDTISIILANARSEMLTHHQEHVQRVCLHQDPSGAHTSIELGAADGTKAILEFRSPVLPETVDGVMEMRE